MSPPPEFLERVSHWASTTPLATLLRTLAVAAFFASVTAIGASWYFDHAIAVKLLRERDLLEAKVLVAGIEEALQQSLHLLDDAALAIGTEPAADDGSDIPARTLAEMLHQYPGVTGMIVTDDSGQRILSLGRIGGDEGSGARITSHAGLRRHGVSYEVAVLSGRAGALFVVVDRTLPTATGGGHLKVVLDPGELPAVRSLGGDARLHLSSLRLAGARGRNAHGGDVLPGFMLISADGIPADVGTIRSSYDAVRNLVSAEYRSALLPITISLEALAPLGSESWRWVGYKEVALLASIVLFLRGLMHAANRLVVSPLRRLHGHIGRIIAGDLETPLPAPAGVLEVAEASRGVERMRSALHQSTLTLKREIVDRTVELSRQIMRFDMAVANLKHGLAMFDASQRLIVCNDEFLAQFGLTPAQAKPGTRMESIIIAFLLANGQRIEGARLILKRLFRVAGYRQARPNVVRRRNGLILEITCHTMPDGGVLFTVQDATERRRYQAGLAAAVDVAQQASQAKSLFLANMSHELRTPLNAIIGFSEVLLNDGIVPATAAQQKEYVRNIYESGRHLLGLITNILNLSKAESGSLKVSVEPMDLEHVMRTSLRSVEHVARQNRVTVSAEIAPDCPVIETDAIKVIQVVTNLVSNAVKFSSPDGTVRVVARPAVAWAGGIEITVTDNGVGMAEADIPKAFEVFHQLDSSLQRRYDGAGLGLPLSKRLVELMSGDLQLASQLGVGTEATVILPDLARRDLAQA